MSSRAIALAVAGAGAIKKSKLSAALLVALLAMSIGAAKPSFATTIYTYTGNSFDLFLDNTPPAGAYDTSMEVTGWFELLNPLPGSLTNSSVLGSVLDFSFYDGRNTITSSNGSASAFNVTTDASGNIVVWQIDLNTPIPVAVGQQAFFIRTNDNEDRGSLLECTFATFNCQFGLSDIGRNLINPGVWTASVPGPIAGAGLPGLVLAFGGLLAWWRRKRKAQLAVVD